MKLSTLQEAFRHWLHAERADAAAQLGGGPGLNVYLNNYRSQLIAALENSFPQLQRWLGDTAFLAAAARHVEASPPRSWTLDAYGEDFPETIAALYPDNPECAELARLEWALATTFTMPDVAAFSAEALGTIDWESARIAFVPTLALLPVTTDVAALWRSLATGITPSAVQRSSGTGAVLLWRSGFNPSFRAIEQAEAAAIAKLDAGTPFGRLCARLADEDGEAAAIATVGAWLGDWLRDGLITAIR